MLLESAIIITINFYPSSQEIHPPNKDCGFKNKQCIYIRNSVVTIWRACCIKTNRENGTGITQQ